MEGKGYLANYSDVLEKVNQKKLKRSKSLYSQKFIIKTNV
jgi:hypothetical protein